MKALTTLFTVLAVATIGSAGPCRKSRCNADDCARLVTGTRIGLPTSRLADCSSFLAVTVTPTPVTTTVTITPDVLDLTTTITTVEVTQVVATVTQVSISVIRPPRRRNEPGSPVAITPANATAILLGNAIPAYASASCSVASRYSSACSCAGATASTATAPAQTVTVSVTAVQPVSVSSVVATTTVQATATEVEQVQATGLTCGALINPRQGCGCYYQVTCGRRATGGLVFRTVTVQDELACLNACDNSASCTAANFSFSSGQCSLVTGDPQSSAATISDGDSILLTQQTCDQGNGGTCL